MFLHLSVILFTGVCIPARNGAGVCVPQHAMGQGVCLAGGCDREGDVCDEGCDSVCVCVCVTRPGGVHPSDSRGRYASYWNVFCCYLELENLYIYPYLSDLSICYLCKTYLGSGEAERRLLKNIRGLG